MRKVVWVKYGIRSKIFATGYDSCFYCHLSGIILEFAIVLGFGVIELDTSCDS